MNAKREAAEKAVSFICSGTAVGLGAGATMAYMADCLQKEKNERNLRLYTSSKETRLLLQQYGFAVLDIASVARLDMYFDSCDQFDKNLNALKSGGGIHTMEKLLASMATEFVLVGDDSKYAEWLETKYPLVIEALPQSVRFVTSGIKELFPYSTVATRRTAMTKDEIVTENGNLLLDVWFTEMPELSSVNPLLKTITGVVETSLFYDMANKAVIAGRNGVQVLTKS